MAGRLSHFYLMLKVVVPFERLGGTPGPVPLGVFTELSTCAEDFHDHES